MIFKRIFIAFSLLCALTVALGTSSLVYAVDVPAPINALDQILGNGKSTLSNFADRFHELSSVEPGADEHVRAFGRRTKDEVPVRREAFRRIHHRRGGVQVITQIIRYGLTGLRNGFEFTG